MNPYSIRAKPNSQSKSMATAIVLSIPTTVRIMKTKPIQPEASRISSLVGKPAVPVSQQSHIKLD